MGRKRSVRRKNERNLKTVLKRGFLPAQAKVDVKCAVCGKNVPVVVPALPKKGFRVVARAVCACGNPIAVTVDGRGRTPPQAE